MRGRTVAPLVMTVTALALGVAASAAPPSPVAAVCGSPFAVTMHPGGIIDVYQYRFVGGLEQSTNVKLASASRVGWTLTNVCTQTRVLAPPKRIRGLAGPWPRSVTSVVFCGEGGTIQIRPILQRGRVVGTRLLVMRSEHRGSAQWLVGRHVIVDVTLQRNRGGISFDSDWCSRNVIAPPR